MKAKVRIPSSKELCNKGNARIFVQSQDEVEKVKRLLREYDMDEYEGYYPNGDYIGNIHGELVTVFNPQGNNVLIYNHKFDIKDVNEFIALCASQDIYIVVISCNQYNFKDGYTLEQHLEQELGMGFISDFVYNKCKDW